jgi:hypothetical protein
LEAAAKYAITIIIETLELDPVILENPEIENVFVRF